jgi:hypothetical protein
VLAGDRDAFRILIDRHREGATRFALTVSGARFKPRTRAVRKSRSSTIDDEGLAELEAANPFGLPRNPEMPRGMCLLKRRKYVPVKVREAEFRTMSTTHC